MNTDYIYWTFSSAAQSISAFIALLLAGYALVHNLMATALDRDETLDEIHTALRLSYHKRLIVLAWLTGAAVILSLVVVYFTRVDDPVSGWVLLFVGVIDFLAIVFGVAFVVSIVDPKKYQKVAEKVLEDDQVVASGISQTAPVVEFFGAFQGLERQIGRYLKDKDLYIPSRGTTHMPHSFNQMINALLLNELIDSEFRNELFEINRYKNLVFHGQVRNINEKLVERVRAATERLEKIL